MHSPYAWLGLGPTEGQGQEDRWKDFGICQVTWRGKWVQALIRYCYSVLDKLLYLSFCIRRTTISPI
jgi:hypothetical protein